MNSEEHDREYYYNTITQVGASASSKFPLVQPLSKTFPGLT